MQFRAMLIDEETKEYKILNQIDAEKAGIELVDLDVAWDGRWYLAGYAPAKPQSEIDAEEVAELKRQLTASDYAIIKIAEGAATAEEYAELIAKRQEWRARINELEGK